MFHVTCGYQASRFFILSCSSCSCWGFGSAFISSQLQRAVAWLSLYALWKTNSLYLLKVRAYFESFLNVVRSKGDLALN